MKKIFYLLLVLLLGLTLSACSGNATQEKKSEEIIGMPNPIISYETLDEVNEKVGVHIVIPSSIPASEYRYSTIKDETAQVTFILDEHEWTVRGSKIVNQDISGIHDENNYFAEGEDFGLYLNDYYLDRIFTEGMQYTIVMSNAKGYDEETFSNYVFEIESAIKKASDPNGIAGNYMDVTSQRASMEITKYEDTYEITVRWPSSASEEKIWFMSATLKDDKLSYAGEDIMVYEFDENGNETVSDSTPSTATNNIGYFEIKNGQLYWTGAAQDQCKDCVFEKVPF